MAYVRKTEDEFQVQGLYQGEWEVVTAARARKDAVANLREYRKNAPETCYRLKTVRVPRAVPA